MGSADFPVVNTDLDITARKLAQITVDISQPIKRLVMKSPVCVSMAA
jgi:hypothetical protein